MRTPFVENAVFILPMTAASVSPLVRLIVAEVPDVWSAMVTESPVV